MSKLRLTSDAQRLMYHASFAGTAIYSHKQL